MSMHDEMWRKNVLLFYFNECFWVKVMIEMNLVKCTNYFFLYIIQAFILVSEGILLHLLVYRNQLFA